MFEEGVKLIDLNSGDSVGISRDELERGIARVQEALRLGYPDEKRGLPALINGYLTLSSFPGQNGESIAARLRGYYLRLQELEPGEPEWAYQYAKMIADRGERIRVLSEGVKLFPRHFLLRGTLGALLCEGDEKSAGSLQLVEAAKVMQPSEAEEYGDDLIANAAQCGDPAGWEFVKGMVVKKRAEAKEQEGEGERGAEGTE